MQPARRDFPQCLRSVVRSSPLENVISSQGVILGEAMLATCNRNARLDHVGYGREEVT